MPGFGELDRLTPKKSATTMVEHLRATERERCAKVIEEIPASASLYENVETAKAVIAFKKYAIEQIRSLG